MSSSNLVSMDCASSNRERMPVSMVISSSPQTMGRNGSGVDSSVGRLVYAARLSSLWAMWMRVSPGSPSRFPVTEQVRTGEAGLDVGRGGDERAHDPAPYERRKACGEDRWKVQDSRCVHWEDARLSFPRRRLQAGRSDSQQRHSPESRRQRDEKSR